jgi:hypothetical protein
VHGAKRGAVRTHDVGQLRLAAVGLLRGHARLPGDGVGSAEQFQR